MHLVLARIEGAPDGVKGISLFIVPKFTLDGEGNPADRNAVSCGSIEEKMGIHGNSTCVMNYDDATGYLLGEENKGLKAMFTMMNHARLDVALQGVAHAARAHAIAADYAGERKQGRRPDGHDARLEDHADVRRMLDEQRSLALGARAMAHVALVEMVRGDAPELVDFLTPVCKVFCAEAGIKAADLGIQVLGGYGYLTEYRVSQTWRDARITSIYEGANGIHALATATRGLKVQGGAGADAFDALVGRLSDHPSVLSQRSLWRQARTKVAAAEDPGALAHDFMQLTADLFYRAVWARIAEVGQSDDLTALADRVLAPPRNWAA